MSIPLEAFQLRTELDRIGSSLPLALEQSINEKYLLHGTKPETLLAVLHNGLNEKYSTIRGLFGGGVYLAERPEKVDQYTTPDSSSNSGCEELHRRLYKNASDHDAEVFYAIVCRATLGFPVLSSDGVRSAHPPHEPIFVSSEKRMLCNIPGSQPAIPYHSLIGSGVQHGPLRFREFIMFESSRVYPEYLLAYMRT